MIKSGIEILPNKKNDVKIEVFATNKILNNVINK